MSLLSIRNQIDLQVVVKNYMQVQLNMLAVEHELPVYQPVNFKSDESQAELASLNADIMIVVAYGFNST